MIVKRDVFIPKFLKILEKKLQKALPEEGFESEMIQTAQKIDITTADHTLEAMRKEHIK